MPTYLTFINVIIAIVSVITVAVVWHRRAQGIKGVGIIIREGDKAIGPVSMGLTLGAARYGPLH